MEVASYLEEAYELDKVKKIYLPGDGASWIKEGLSWIVSSEYVLDYFHLCKYVRIATAHMPECFHRYIWRYIDNFPMINDGRRTWERRYLKALRGA